MCKTPGWFAAYFICLDSLFPLGILWYMLSYSGETGKVKEMGRGRRKDQIISCKYSKKIDEVNTKEGSTGYIHVNKSIIFNCELTAN